MSSPTAKNSVGLINVIPLLGNIALVAGAQLVTYPFRTVRSEYLYADVVNAAVRCMFGRITIAQTRYLNPSTSARYLEYCKNQNVEPQNLTLKGKDGKDIAAHWIGSPDAEKVVVYFHGGGYTLSIMDGYYAYLERLVKDLKGEEAGGRRSVAVLVLAYSLAPEATYPTQLREAATVLEHLVTNTGRSASDIFLSGDSAGGNLALSVLSHLIHPHPDVPAVKLKGPLGGAVLYSPWVGFGTDYPSFRANATLDVLPPNALRKWSAMFLNKANPADPEADPGPVSGDAWTEACLNPASWWNGLHHVVSDIFVVYGSYEVLADPIRELEQALKKGWAEGGGDASRVAFLEGQKESHVAPIGDSMGPRKAIKSESQQAIEKWYRARL